jgi:two-component sensor histidine kinase
LIKISSIYWHKKIKEGQVDSVLFYARQALTLSNRLHAEYGHNESTFLICKALMDKADVGGAREILKMTNGEQNVRLLIVMGEHFVYLPGQKKENLDLAYTFLAQAKSLSSSIRSAFWKNESLVILGKYYFERGDFIAGKNAFLEVINYYKEAGDKVKEAHWWSELGRYMPDTESTYADEINSHTHALHLFHQLHLLRDEGYTLTDMAFVHTMHNNLDTAEVLQLRAISLLKASGEKELYNQYLYLSEIYQSKGDLSKALFYALESLKNMQRLQEKRYLELSYKLIGDIYREMDEPGNSVKYYKLSLENVSPTWIAKYYGYTILKYISEGLIKENKTQEALIFVNDFIRKNPPVELRDREIVAGCIADCYNALKDYRMAEKQYIEMIRLDKAARLNRIKQIQNSSSITGAEAYYLISKFYVNQRRYKAAGPYLSEAFSFGPIAPILRTNLKLMQSRVDSASGNYLGALNNFQQHSAIKDSIFTATKNKELAGLKIQFETAEKEKDIRLLQKEGLLQKKTIEQSAQAKKFIYAGILTLLFMLGIVYNRYLLKQKNNKQLQAQQLTINSTNAHLTQLVGEKEWLLKEVHHRVKNNLQIIISLLNIQSAYLKDDVAMNAIMDSRHRVQAMSLLHQRLYQGENTASISMPLYLQELVSYLSESFNSDRRIIVKNSIENIKLDMTKAVPIGLILNEAVTNSLKYAFQKKARGEINISLTAKSENFLMLRIADNGIGLPDGFNIKESNSFGFKLIKGLVENLGGGLVLKKHPGTTIEIEFENTNITESLYQEERPA